MVVKINRRSRRSRRFGNLRAVRKNRYNIIQSDLEDAYAVQVKTGQDDDRYGVLLIIQLVIPGRPSSCHSYPRSRETQEFTGRSLLVL
jgi:hypothetical protein